MRFNAIATCDKGLEEICIKEINQILNKRAYFYHLGSIYLKNISEEDIFKLNFFSRTLHRIIIILKEGEFNTLEDFEKKVSEINFEEYIAYNQSFAVDAERHGEHDFTSLDIERIVGKIIIERYLTKVGNRLRVNLKNPDILIRVKVRNNHFWVGIDTTGVESLSKRNYRVYNHPAAIKTTVACCMIYLSDWNINEKLLDPMCGGGTIPIEAARMALNIPNRKKFMFENFKFFNIYKWKEFILRYESSVTDVNYNIEGYDISPKHIQGAIKNARSAGVRVKFYVADATKDSLDSDVIVFNPPYGIRMKNPRYVEKLYMKFCENLKRHYWRRVVLITASWDKFKKYLPDTKKEIECYVGNLPAKILIY